MPQSIDEKTFKDEVASLIPELNLIQDEKIREATLQVWCSAMEAGGWNPSDLDKIPFTLLIDPCPASFLTHTRSVAAMAHKMGETINKLYDKDKIRIRMDVLVSGAILHDVGKLLEYAKENEKVVQSRQGKLLRHPFSGAAIAFGKGLPDEVLHIIAMHAKEGNLGKRIPEAIIVHHADFVNFEPFHK